MEPSIAARGRDQNNGTRKNDWTHRRNQNIAVRGVHSVWPGGTNKSAQLNVQSVRCYSSVYRKVDQGVIKKLSRRFGMSSKGVLMEDRGAGDSSTTTFVRVSGVATRCVTISVVSARLIRTTKTTKKANHQQDTNKNRERSLGSQKLQRHARKTSKQKRKVKKGIKVTTPTCGFFTHDRTVARARWLFIVSTDYIDNNIVYERLLFSLKL